MKPLLICLMLASLGGCVSAAATDAGCAAYGSQRPSMPPLNDDAVGRWVDVTDGAMTATCR